MHQIINQLQQLQQQMAQVTQNLQGMQNQLQTITGQVQSQNIEMNLARVQSSSYPSAASSSAEAARRPLNYMSTQQDVGQNARTNSTYAQTYGSQFAERQTGYSSLIQNQGQSNQAQFNPAQINQAEQSTAIASPANPSGINQSALQSVMNADQGARANNPPGRQSEYSSYGRNFQ